MPASMKSLTAAKHATGQVASVLGFWRQDKRYYSVQITDCDPEARNCQVVFDDGYKCWLEAKELHCELVFDKLEEAEIVCCVCEEDKSEPPNDIIMCDSCQQGYHLNCHQPPVERAIVQLDDDQIEWMCNTCLQIAIQARGASELAPSPVPDASVKNLSPSRASSATSKKTPAKTNCKSMVAKTPRRASTAATPKPTSQSTSKSATRSRATPLTPKRAPPTKIKLNKRSSQKASTKSYEKTNSNTQKQHNLQQAHQQVVQLNPEELKEQEPTSTEAAPLCTIKKDLESNKDQSSTDVLCNINGDSSIAINQPIQSDNGRVEKMSPLIIQTARVLAQEPECMDTGDFVQLIGDDRKLVDSIQLISKENQVKTRKKTKTYSAAA